jgi:hypothetical protein
MEIDFNPSQLPPSGPSGTVKRAERAPAATDTASLQSVTDLQDKLNAIPLSRPGKADEMKPLSSHVQYPPDQLLDGVAALLAIHLND